MLAVKETIIVEGRYDKNKLKQIVNAQVIETSGFGIFKDVEKRGLLLKLAEKNGIIVLTDSDSAGFLIRNHLRGILPGKYLKHAYIPRIEGKEKRKEHKSKEGILGVEGVCDDVIIDALKKAGATFIGEGEALERSGNITKIDLYERGLSGGAKSTKLRAKLAEELGFPAGMSANALLEAMNLLITKDEFCKLCQKISENK